MAQNYSLILLCADTNDVNQNYQNVSEQFRDLSNDINIFTDPDECVDFLTDLEDINVILIIDDTVDQQTISLIHDIPQLDCIYVSSRSKYSHSEWLNEWPKVKCIRTTNIPECEASKLTVEQENRDSIAVSFVPMNENGLSQPRNELEPSFMYTQLLKNIILEMNYDEKSIENFVAFCRIGNYSSPNNIDQFEKEYHNKSPIWWYSALPFIYWTLNYALRELKADIIIRMGFFIFDLHDQIKQLHWEQFKKHDVKPFTVYRGQALSKTDFEKLLKTKGGLMSFNNFLSTSKNENVSLDFVQGAITGTETVGILFKMNIDPSIPSSPFADIQGISLFSTEEEVLFSMHTVFRVGEIKLINSDSALYQVELELTADNDEQLRILTKHMENDGGGDTPWKRLANLLFKIDQFDKVEELYTALLEQAPNDYERMDYCNQLLSFKDEQCDRDGIAKYFIEIYEIEKRLLANNSLLDTSDNNIDFSYYNVGEYSKFLFFHNRSPSIDEESLPENHLSSTSYHNNTAGVDNIKTQRSNALFYAKALESFQRALAPDHSCLTTLNSNNIAEMFEGIDDDSRVLLFNEKILEIRQKFLPPDHRDLALSYHIVGSMYAERGEDSKALSFYEKALEILKKNLPVNHPMMAIIYDHIGLTYDSMEEYSKALAFCEKALGIRQKSLPENHCQLRYSYKNIASIYREMKDYTKAVLFYEKVLPKNDPSLGIYYMQAGVAYENLEKYSEALSYFKKSLEIYEKTPDENRNELAEAYNKIGSTCFQMADYTTALHFNKKALEIFQKILPPVYLGLMSTYNNIGAVYAVNGDYSEALSYFQLALDISKFLPSQSDYGIEALQRNIAKLKEILNDSVS